MHAAPVLGGVLGFGEERGGRWAVVGTGCGDGTGQEQATLDRQQGVVGSGAQPGLAHPGGGLVQSTSVGSPTRTPMVTPSDSSAGSWRSAACWSCSPRGSPIPTGPDGGSNEVVLELGVPELVGGADGA